MPETTPLVTLLTQLIARLDRISGHLERAFPVTDDTAIFERSIAYLWKPHGPSGRPGLHPVAEPNLIPFEALKNVDRQKALIEQNTRQFVQGRPANNVLLTGAKGTGKSSLVRACLHGFHEQGLRLVEVDKDHLADLPAIIDLLRGRPERYILFADDLSFEAGESGYKGLKSALDGSIAGQAANCLVYATSNRRHLLPERMADNLSYARGEDGEVHPGEAVEQVVSLSERFGLWVAFYSFSQDEYLAAVAQWLRHYGADEESIVAIRQDAINWATQRGSRSGRVAYQYAKDWAGRQ
ncbi:ATP-binding protein [Methylococcus sp. EFPC2]|uniref:ATP-binding protein n=1 Tax=Methylococcus sp. EFPC2 TaxID=2812648 RepID=UPI001967F0D9|nr:ATP-binding protein [Methylococcus sp. EFPC2]QSA97246.1 ATP-binding protein [Methylococcus sp. EFPC2]